FIRAVVRSELEGDLEHVLTEKRDPRGAVGLLQMAAGRQRRAAVKDADIVQPKKAALEQALAETVLAVQPPAEVPRKLAEHALQKRDVGPAPQRLLHSVDEDRRPRLHRRIDVAEVPFVGRNLAARVKVEVFEKQIELTLRKIDVGD